MYSKKTETLFVVVLRSKLVDERCRVQFPIALVDIAVLNFPWFSPKLAFRELEYRRKITMASVPSLITGFASGQLDFNLKPILS